jgi:5-methylcytosine-specific restriction endonuclease McrA
MDHLIPLSRGGYSTKENLVPCCKECNNRKKYLLPAEFADLIAKERSLREEATLDAEPKHTVADSGLDPLPATPSDKKPDVSL